MIYQCAFLDDKGFVYLTCILFGDSRHFWAQLNFYL